MEFEFIAFLVAPDLLFAGLVLLVLTTTSVGR